MSLLLAVACTTTRTVEVPCDATGDGISDDDAVVGVDGGSGGGGENDAAASDTASSDAAASDTASTDTVSTDTAASDTASTDTAAVDAGANDTSVGDTTGSDVGPQAPGSAMDACAGGGAVPASASVDTSARSLTMSCGSLTLFASVWADGVIRLRYAGGQPDPAPDRSYAVAVDKADSAPFAAVGLGDGSGGARVCTEHLSVTVHADCRVVVRDGAGLALVDDGGPGEQLGYSEGPGDVNGPVDWSVAVRRRIGSGEHFYGFGEKNGPLDQRGASLLMWNSDVPGYGPTQDPLYQSVPFFTGLRGHTAYGVLHDNSYMTRFDVGATDPTVYEIRSKGGEVDQFVFAGPALSDVMERYTWLTGRMPLYPRWTLGYHQSRWGYYPESYVKEIAAGLRSRDIPADAIWLDIDHMDGYRSFTWSPTNFPDPKGLMDGLAADGFHTVAIIDPALKQDPGWAPYDTMMANSWFVRLDNGAPYIGQVWPGASVFPDFTNPASRAWWGDLVPALTDMGVEGIWCDMNEPANFIAEHFKTVPDWTYGDGEGLEMSMAEMKNVYGSAMSWATYDGVRKHLPNKRAFVLTRAAYAGVQRWAAAWTGDVPSTFPSMRAQLPMLLNLGLSGETFTGTDAGGWAPGGDAEVYARWMAFGAISPFFRQHSDKAAVDKEPWRFGPEVEAITRSWIEWRYRLLPYLYTLLEEGSRTGAPILRPLVWEFQGDGVAHTVDDVAMLGPWLLAAPVFEPGATSRTFYLPAGRWFDERSGRVFEGPGFATVNLQLAAMPVLVREGAIIPHQQLVQYSDEAPIDPLTLGLWPAEQQTEFTLYEDDGVSRDFEAGVFRRLRYTLQRHAAGATLQVAKAEGPYVPPARRLVLKVARVDGGATGVSVDGAALPALSSLDALATAQQGWIHDANERVLWAVVPDGDDMTVEFAYDPALVAFAPPVTRRFEVKVPDGDHGSDVPHIALSTKGWTHLPMAWDPDKPGHAYIDVDLPRGAWFEYKYTRGSWASVEKTGDCGDLNNRYAYGQAHPAKSDVIAAWNDWCGG